MTFRHLKIFLTVCEYQNMTRAAKALYLSQPSVSQSIAELETFYDVKLFERLKHRIFLTTAGERLQTYARHILSLADQARKELANFDLEGTLRVGASLTIGTYLLPMMIAAFRQKMPLVEVFTRVENTDTIEQLLLADKIDLGVVEGSSHSPDLIEKILQTDTLVFIASPEHPLSQRKKISIADLKNSAFIVREDGSGTRSVFENAMQSADIPWKTVGVYNNIEAIKQAVQQNLGLSVVPQISVKREIEQGLVVSLKLPELQLTRQFKFIYHRQKFLTQAMQTLLEMDVN